MNIVFPSNDETYIEINGERVGSVEKYKETIHRDSILIEAIGENEPIANLYGRVRYHVELSKAYIYTMLIGGEKNIKELSNFELAVGISDTKIIYYGCEWIEINKNIGLDFCVYENIKISATQRKNIKC